MLELVLRRVVTGILAIWVIWSAVFLISRCVPGDAFQVEDRSISQMAIAHQRKQFRLDQSIWRQYLGEFIDRMFFKPPVSMCYANQDMLSILQEALGPTLMMGAVALLLILGLGVTLGWLAALHQNSWIDNLISGLGALVLAFPMQLRGLALIHLFASKLKLLPTTGWEHPIAFSTAFMPIITLATPNIIELAQLSRASLIEILNTNYIKAARAKGLSEAYIFKRHALIPALIPLLSVLFDNVKLCLTGSILVEDLFKIPGLGGKLFESAKNRDYSMVSFLILVITAIAQVFLLLTECGQVYLDPRLRDKRLKLH